MQTICNISFSNVWVILNLKAKILKIIFNSKYFAKKLKIKAIKRRIKAKINKNKGVKSKKHLFLQHETSISITNENKAYPMLIFIYQFGFTCFKKA
ncbi:hypothetical protein HMPREF0971_02776 [Segatella oris F0302]|uniref:Uncharacterized protein n=1 Tax=Segatella oris F0302 TaxID=649760 RepID=D1QUU1_9BACT|nr:hypothetical protein HMPREF0971_02776 [Segatella oris F0302]